MGISRVVRNKCTGKYLIYHRGGVGEGAGVGERVIVVKLPPGVSEEEARRAIEEALARLEGRMSIDELRERLGIRPEDLVDEIEVEGPGPEELRRRERERVAW